MKYFIYFIIVIVAASVIAGFFVVGSPQQQRLRRFDERRVQDLQLIQGQIVNFWQNKQRLPLSLGELHDDISGFTAPADPQTGTTYQYEITNNLSFRLCSTFNFTNTTGTDQPEAVPAAPRAVYPEPYSKPLGQGDNWEHPEGNYCYDRTIDPELYPPVPKNT